MVSWLRGGAGNLPTGDLPRNEDISFAERNHYRTRSLLVLQ